MIKNEQHLKQEFIKTSAGGVGLSLLVTFVFKDFSIVGGYLLGAILSYIVLILDISYVDALLQTKVKKVNPLQLMTFLLKLGIYVLGFLVAVYVPAVFCLYSVAIGYLTNKVTIYRLSAKKEVN